MLTPNEREIKLRRLDEVLAEMESEPWPPEERQAYLLQEMERLEYELGMDDLERKRAGKKDDPVEIANPDAIKAILLAEAILEGLDEMRDLDGDQAYVETAWGLIDGRRQALLMGLGPGDDLLLEVERSRPRKD